MGSALRLAWAPDGTQLAAAGGAGVVAVGRLVGRRAEGGAASALLEDERTIRVADAAGDVKEVLELRDPVVKFSLGAGGGGGHLGQAARPQGEDRAARCRDGKQRWRALPAVGSPQLTCCLANPHAATCFDAAGYGHLVAATATQCYIYSTSNFNTPHMVDLAQPPHLLLQCERCMLLVDAAAGMQVRLPIRGSARWVRMMLCSTAWGGAVEQPSCLLACLPARMPTCAGHHV